MRIVENPEMPGRAQNCPKADFQESSVTVQMKVLSSCHSSRASSLLPGFIICFLTCSVHRMGSAKFTVIGPPDPVAAILGQEAVLPCHLSPRMSAANMEVRWFRPEFVSFVHLYRDGKDQYEGRMPEYEGRTELLKAGLTDGNVPLRILNIRPSDEGQYHCFVQDGTFYEETVLELRVAGLGSAPLISVEGHQDGGIRVVCRSAGWYPEPEKQTETERQKIVSAFQQLRQLLEEQERLLLAQLEKLDKEIVKIQNENITKLSEGISRLSELISEMEGKCQKPASEFLQDVRSTLSRCEKGKFQQPEEISPELEERVSDFSQKTIVLMETLRKFKGLGSPIGAASWIGEILSL
ncbi:unnamed protein product [Caretta caretta]